MMIQLDTEDVLYLINHLPAMKDIDDPVRFMKIVSQVHGAMVGNDSPKKNPSGWFKPHLTNPNKKVAVIKMLREMTGLGLKEAVDAVNTSTQFPLPEGWNGAKFMQTIANSGLEEQFVLILPPEF